MRWVFASAVAVIAALWLLLQVGLVPAPLVPLAHYVVGTICSLGLPLFFMSIYLAPGLYRDLNHDVRASWERLHSRRLEIEDLERKIAHLNKSHHMLQLGALLARQGKPAQAHRWLEQAHQLEPDSLEAKYRLALCHFEQRHFEPAADLLESVHAVKPDHDYGLAYLRLAQSQQFLGRRERASEVYRQMLRFYPGHAEALYHFAQLTADEGDATRAGELMREVLRSVRHSPSFQRRRNRHWALKARWWLWRQR